MNYNTPKISVIMPVYNSSKYLKKAIDSILKQTFSDFELIILNDCSTDDSKVIIENYALEDNRIVFIDKTHNVGPALLRNEGIDNAKADFIALMDSDDVALPKRFEKQVVFLENNPDIDLCGTWYTIFGEGIKDKIVKNAQNHDLLKVSFLNDNPIGNPTVMLRKRIFASNRFNPDYVPVEDYELWSRTITKHKFYNIPETLLLYRWHNTNISQTKKENTENALFKIKKNQLEQFGIVDENEIHSFINALVFQKKLKSSEVYQAILSGKILLERNQELNNFDTIILKKNIEKVLIRTIRNSQNYNLQFFTKLRSQRWIFSKIPYVDKIIIFYKCLIKM